MLTLLRLADIFKTYYSRLLMVTSAVHKLDNNLDRNNNKWSNMHPLEVVGRGSETQLQVGIFLKYLMWPSRVPYFNLHTIYVIIIIEIENNNN